MVVLITPRQQQRWWLVQQTQSQHHNQGSSNPSCSWFWFFHSWFCKKMTWTCFSFVKRDGWCYKLSNTPTSLRYPFSCCNWMCISFGKFKKKNFPFILMHKWTFEHGNTPYLYPVWGAKDVLNSSFNPFTSWSSMAISVNSTLLVFHFSLNVRPK